VGPGHRLREPRGVPQARVVLYPRQAPPGGRRRPPPHAARDPRKDLRPHPALQIKGRAAGGGVLQVRRRLQARGARGHPGAQDLLQGLRHQRPGPPHHRDRRLHRPRDQSRFHHEGLQGRPAEVPRAHPRLREGLRLAQSVRGVSVGTLSAMSRSEKEETPAPICRERPRKDFRGERRDGAPGLPLLQA